MIQTHRVEHSNKTWSLLASFSSNLLAAYTPYPCHYLLSSSQISGDSAQSFRRCATPFSTPLVKTSIQNSPPTHQPLDQSSPFLAPNYPSVTTTSSTNYRVVAVIVPTQQAKCTLKRVEHTCEGLLFSRPSRVRLTSLFHVVGVHIVLYLPLQFRPNPSSRSPSIHDLSSLFTNVLSINSPLVHQCPTAHYSELFTLGTLHGGLPPC